MEHHSPDSSVKEYLKFMAVIVGIVGATLAIHNATESGGTSDFVRWFMGVFMLTFASFKFAGYKMFVMMYPGYDIIAAKFKQYAYAYPFIELGLASLFLFNLLPDIRSVLVITIMGVSLIGVSREVYRRKTGIHCACLGNIIKLPLSTVSVVENGSMVIMAAVMLAL